MQVSFFEILRCYQEFKIAKQVGAKANSLFFAILTKANSLRFPERLTIYNSEALDLSGLTKNELHPARNKLTQVRINGQPVLKYSGNGTRQAGVYEINYKGFYSYFSDYTENQINYSTNHGTNHDIKTLGNFQKSDTLLINKQNYNLLPPHASSVSDPFLVYQQEIGQFSETIKDNMIDWIDGDYFDEPKLMIVEAIKEAAIHEKRSWAYVDRVLRRCLQENVRTLEQMRQKKAEFEKAKTAKMTLIRGGGSDGRSASSKQSEQTDLPFTGFEKRAANDMAFQEMIFGTSSQKGDDTW